MSINFLDCVSNNTIDNYLFLDGISEKLGYKRYAIIPEPLRVSEEKNSNLNAKITLSTVVKIISYIIFFIPLLALAYKAYDRYSNKYCIDANAQPSQLPQATPPSKPAATLLPQSAEAILPSQKKPAPSLSQPTLLPSLSTPPLSQPVAPTVAVTSNSPRELLNLQNFISLCAPNQQVMIYGLRDFKYGDVIDWLKTKKEQQQFKDIFDSNIGLPKMEGFASRTNRRTFENREIPQLLSDGMENQGPGMEQMENAYILRNTCKSALVNIVLENVQRKKQGLQIIPIVFIIGKDKQGLDINKILKNKDDLDKLSEILRQQNVTDAEIRRAYRLCFDESLPKEICEVAEETFKFITLTTNEASQPEKYGFSFCAKPWQNHQWQALWNDRERAKPLRVNHQKAPKRKPWRQQVRTFMTASA